MKARLPILLAVLLVVGACSSGSAPTAPPSDPGDATRAQLDWFVDTLNSGSLDAAEYERRFGAEFRRQVPFESGFLPIVEGMSQVAGRWRLAEYQPGSAGAAEALVVAGGEQMRVSITVVDDHIDSLFLRPAALADPPTALSEVPDRVKQYGELSMFAGEVVGDACVPVFEKDGDRVVPIGSTFKLYVLDALASAVADGTVDWNDTLTVTPDVKSIPSGELQNVPDGTEKTVEEVATLMISVSDNTAADMLIGLLGRTTVEDALAEAGMTDPSLDRPFLTTREFAALKAGAASDRLSEYLAADEAGRRRILDEIAGVSVSDLGAGDFTDPVEVDRLEWFASPSDLCRVLARLHERSAMPGLEPLRTVLTTNPGIPADQGQWDSVWFKGGSEPGVLSTAWLTERSDGRVFSLTAAIVNRDKVFPSIDPVLQLAAARDLLSTQP